MRRGETFTFNGSIISVPAGAGFNGLQPTVLVSGVSASGTRTVIESVIVHVLNIASDQITLTLRRNGAPALSGFTQLPATFFDSYPLLEVHEEFSPGTFDIVASNKSGTTQPGAVAAVAADCHASLLGYQLSPQAPPVKSFWRQMLSPWIIAALFPLMGINPVFAQNIVTPGVTTSRSAQAVACVNPTTFVLESCGGGSSTGLTDTQLRASPVPVSGTFFQATQPVSGTFFQATQPVSGTFFQATQPVSGTVTTTPPANASTNITQFGSNAVVTGTGVGGVGIPRMTTSNDSGVILQTGANTIGALTANQSVNLTQGGGSNLISAGVLGALAIGGTGANNTVIAQNPVLIGCETFNLGGGTQPVSSTVGNQRRMLCSEEGSLVVTPYGANRFSCFVEAVTVTTQCQAAPGAGLRLYITGFVASNEAATVQSLDLVQGTGANCATGLTAKTHKHQMGTVATTTSPFLVSVTYHNPVILSTASAACVRPSAATAFGATVTGYIAP
jgi:hypothetical protein